MRVETYDHWYNECRPHSALGGRTPAEVWRGERLPLPMALRERDGIPVSLAIRRLRCRDDPRLPILHITRRAA